MSAISSPANVEDDAYLVWAQLHGLVTLKADGFITRPLSKFVDGPSWAPPRPCTIPDRRGVLEVGLMRVESGVMGLRDLSLGGLAVLIQAL